MNENQQQCKSCSKENTNRVPIMRIIERLDAFFAKNDLNSAEKLLEYWQKEAESIGDARGLIEILNEEIGLYRRLGNKEKGLAAVERSLKIIKDENLGELLSSGTIYVNAATTMKAFGLAEKALPYYEAAQKIYRLHNADSYKTAALHNNMAAAYAELMDFDKAEKSYKKAIELLGCSAENYGEIAVSYVNLAHLYADINSDDERISVSLEKAWEYLKDNSLPHNSNYAFICSKCAPSFGYFGYFLKEKELNQISEKIYGGY